MMGKKFVVVFLLLCGSLGLFSQSEDAFDLEARDTIPHYKGLFFGINGAVYTYIIANQNNYGQKEMDYDGVQISGIFGPQVGYGLNRRWQLRTGIYVNQTMGQEYEDFFNDKRNYQEVNLTYTYVPLMARWVLKNQDSNSKEGTVSGLPPAEEGIVDRNKKQQRDEHFFITFGPQIGWLTNEQYVFQHDGMDVSFLDFIIDAGVNPHQLELTNRLSQSDQAENLDLHKKIDLQWLLGLGWQKYLSPQILFSAELRGGISILDINSEDWQYENREGEYDPSRNAFGGMFISIEYIF